MKTLTVGAIAALCALAALSTAGGHQHRAHARLGHGLRAKAFTWDNPDGYPNVTPDTSETLYECGARYGATEDDVDNFLRHYGGQPLDNREQQCVAGCFFDRVEILVDNQFDKDEYTKMKIQYWGQENAVKAADFCEAELADVPQENCAMGGAFAACDLRNKEQYGDH